jgi:hypothetical protein
MAVWSTPTEPAVAVNSAVADPGATVTAAGTVSAAMLLDSDTLAPPVPAAFDRVTVQVELAPDKRLLGKHDSAATATAVAPPTLQYPSSRHPLIDPPRSTAIISIALSPSNALLKLIGNIKTRALPLSWTVVPFKSTVHWPFPELPDAPGTDAIQPVPKSFARYTLPATVSYFTAQELTRLVDRDELNNTDTLARYAAPRASEYSRANVWPGPEPVLGATESTAAAVLTDATRTATASSVSPTPTPPSNTVLVLITRGGASPATVTVTVMTEKLPPPTRPSLLVQLCNALSQLQPVPDIPVTVSPFDTVSVTVAAPVAVVRPTFDTVNSNSAPISPCTMSPL